ncbi:MAG: outer membrane beta-barrel protein [Burkholderiales bacterium]
MLKRLSLSIMFFAASTGIASAAPAAAEFTNFYGVLSVGRAKNSVQAIAVDNYDLANGFATSTTSASSASNVGKIQLGYAFGKTFALEGGYNYMGKATFNTNTNLGSFNGNRETSLFNLDMVGKIPLNDRFSVLGRVGGYYWKTESQLPNAATRSTTKIGENGFDIKFGAGVQYEFTDRFGMRAEYERFNGIGKSTSTGDSKVNQITVGAVLKF